jgi:hypothetical protein
MKIMIITAMLFAWTVNAYAVCTEFNKSGCDSEEVCQEEWGIYSDRYLECMRRHEAETERLEREDERDPFMQGGNQPIVVGGQNNIVTVVNQKTLSRN